MKAAIIIHGMPSQEEYYNPDSPAQSNKHWLPWLQRQLILNDILAQTPELPEPYAPDYEKWTEIFDQWKIDQDTMLIGHSCGAGFLVRWLSESKRKVGKVALVAPWLDPSKKLHTGFFAFNIDPGMVERADKFAIFYAKNDSEEIHKSINLLREKISTASFIELEAGGHFVFEHMKKQQFPQLADFLLTEQV
jgi:uncharacterized protein